MMKTKLNYLLVFLAAMMFVPSTVKGVTTTLDFGDAGRGHYFQYVDPTKGYYATVNMSSTDYSGISGAKKGDHITYKYGNTRTIDISRLAFVFNSTAHGNEDNTDAGLYLRRDGTNSGLYAGAAGNTEFAILGLKPDNKVTINFSKRSNVTTNECVYCITQGIWMTSGTSITVTNLGDLKIGVIQGIYISSITIEEEIAEYTIRTNNDNSTEFWFTKDGTLEVNDFAIPYMSVSFGSASDYLIVQGTNVNDYAAHMFQTTGQYAGTETLSTNSNNYFQPSAGNFYAFKPTGGGRLYVSGSLTGRTHLFVYNPALNGTNSNWDERYSNNVFYSKTFESGSFDFDVEKDKTYYICINNQSQDEINNNYAFHLHWFKFLPTFRIEEHAKVVDLDHDVVNGTITLTKIHGAGSSSSVTVKRCTANIDQTTVNARIVDDGNGANDLIIDEPTFDSNKDNAGTIILDVETSGGDATFVVTFPYHAAYGMDAATGRSTGHVWNFMDPRVSDSNIGNCKIRQSDGTYSTGTTTGILSIGQHATAGSQLRVETDNRKWTFGWSIKDLNDDITDPMYKNVSEMKGNNADMIWETEGLWFDTNTNLSCLYNENVAAVYSGGTPVQLDMFSTMTADPDRYVGLLADANRKSSFTIPGLKDGDRVLIFMKSGEKSGADREAIFLNIEGARDAVGTVINSNYLYGAGGTLWQHDRLEGCYHFIKNGDGDMKFYMVRGAICKLLSIRIYSGKRMETNGILKMDIDENGEQFSSPLLFMNEEGDETGKWGRYQLHYRGKGDQMKPEIVAYSGNLSLGTSFSSSNFALDDAKLIVTIRSTVGNFGVFRLRLNQMDFVHNNIEGQGYTYVSDFCDRNFTVGYRETLGYPYTWDLTDIRSFSGSDITTESTKYVESTYNYQPKGMDISLWDENGYMIIGNPNDRDNFGDIFSQNKADFGNQLYANDKIIPETKGLWFYMDDNRSIYNRCLRITSQGMHFVNQKLEDGSHDPWWNFKMVVPSVPTNGAVYMRMKRDGDINDNDFKYSDQDNKDVLFLNTRFAWGTGAKTSLSESGTPYNTLENGTAYSFFKVDGTTDEYILTVRNNTGAANHLQFTLNGWIVEKVAVSTDPKQLNPLGWATESRDRDIDAQLTSYFTGKTIKTYMVRDVDYNDKSVTLQDISYCRMPKVGVSKVNEQEVIDNATINNACILRNMAGSPLQIVNGGFHLFVPDMHGDTQLSSPGGFTSQMKAQLRPGTVRMIEDGKTNYAFTYQYVKVNPNTGEELDPESDVITGVQAFYRIVSQGATSTGNQGYLPVTTSAASRFSIMLDGENIGLATQLASLPVMDAKEDQGTERYYNLNGQQMSGKPNRNGLYIMNGKKVYINNK